jgi:hypothetical protein
MLAACTTGVPPAYRGADSGKVVIGIGATNNTYYKSHTFLFHRMGTKKTSMPLESEGNFLTYYQNPSALHTSQTHDYETNAENGAILLAELAPGDYEIYNFSSVLRSGGGYFEIASSKSDFSIRFTVRPNETTYLGNYQANAIRSSTALFLKYSSGIVFVVSDRMRDDITLLMKRHPDVNLGKTIDYTPSVASIMNPFFVEKFDGPR